VPSRADRSAWPVRRFDLGDEPLDDLSASTTPEQRLDMVGTLTLDSWALSGRAVPAYSRPETPVTTRPAARRG
jgi:hypothetical protein